MVTSSFLFLLSSGNYVYDTVCASLPDGLCYPVSARFQPLCRMLKTFGSDKFCENKRWSLEARARMPGTTCLHQQRVLQSAWGMFLMCPSMGSCSQPLFDS